MIDQNRVSLSPALSTTVSPFYGKPVAKFLTISIQNANLARAEARTALRVNQLPALDLRTPAA